jgi:DNA-binding LytR/AlgR family response regulator
MNVLIVEDEKLTALRLENLLHQYDPAIQVLAQIPSVSKTIKWLKDSYNTRPDLIFLDIHLEDDLGFRIIEQLQITTPIIFTTAYNEYTLQAFKANSVDYLLKPIDANELATALNKFKKIHQAPLFHLPEFEALKQLLTKSQTSTYKTRFMVSVGSKLRSINTSEIAYFSFEDKTTFLTTREGTRLIVDYSLDKLSQLLNPSDFFRINRSLLVSLSAIHTAHTYSGGKLKLDLEPPLKHDVFVSGDRITDFKEWLGK